MCGMMIFLIIVRCHVSGCLVIPVEKLRGGYAKYFLVNSEISFVELLESDSSE